ncbi:MAG: tetratricopeptide repeat protein [Saprospiraceae bacterium]|nr:tetratricopeptide repeat protein [Saprospiraceae bacterium]
MNLKRSLAYYELQESNYQNAIKYYHEAIKFYDNKKRYDPALLLTIYLYLSEAYRENGEFDKAINYRLKGYELSDPKLQNLDTLYKKFIDSIAYINPTINYILGNDICVILSKRYEKSKNITDLKLALKFMELSLLPQNSPVQSSDESKELTVFNDYARYYIDNAIPLIFRLYKLTGSQIYINKYIELIAYNKAKVSTANNQEIANKYGVNEKLYMKEKYLNSRISMIKSTQNFGYDSISSWTQQLQKIYVEYSKHYPEYICETRQSKAKSVSYLQSILPKNTACIQYDIVDNKVYIFYFTKNRADIEVKHYDKADLLSLYKYQSGEIELDSIYFKLSLEVFRNLIRNHFKK